MLYARDRHKEKKKKPSKVLKISPTEKYIEVKILISYKVKFRPIKQYKIMKLQFFKSEKQYLLLKLCH